MDPLKKKPGKKGKGKGRDLDGDDDDDDGRAKPKVKGKPGPKPKPKPVMQEKIAQLNAGAMLADVTESPATKKKGKKVSLAPLPEEDYDKEDVNLRKSRRQATVASTLEMEKRQHEASKKATQRAAYGGRAKIEYVATQEELLEEAKETEAYNADVLRIYHQLELEKKTSHKKAVM